MSGGRGGLRLAFPATLPFVLLLPVLLLARNGAVGGVPAAMVDGLLETIAAPLAPFGLHQGVIETGLGGVQGFTGHGAFAIEGSCQCGGVLGGDARLEVGEGTLMIGGEAGHHLGVLFAARTRLGGEGVARNGGLQRENEKRKLLRAHKSLAHSNVL